jgi:hypothetical protein
MQFDAQSADLRAVLFTPLSFGGADRLKVSSGLWFSGHLLCFEHFLCSPFASGLRPRVHNARLRGAVNI